MKFYSRVAKGLKLKVGKFGGLSPTFVEVTGEKLGGDMGGGGLPPSAMLNKVKRREKNVKANIFINDFLTLLSGIPQGSICLN